MLRRIIEVQNEMLKSGCGRISCLACFGFLPFTYIDFLCFNLRYHPKCYMLRTFIKVKKIKCWSVDKGRLLIVYTSTSMITCYDWLQSPLTPKTPVNPSGRWQRGIVMLNLLIDVRATRPTIFQQTFSLDRFFIVGFSGAPLFIHGRRGSRGW